MYNHVPVSFHTMPKNIHSLADFLESIHFKKKVMVFFSKGCYEILKKCSNLLGETIYPFNSKNFTMNNTINSFPESFSILSIYSGEWVYLENLFSDNIYFDSIVNLPKEILFVSLEDEFLFRKTHAFIVLPNKEENPVNCIIDNYSCFKNSILVLTESAFKRLSKSTNIICKHNGTYRLSWNYEVNYPGGTITLKAFNNGKYFCIENMDFPFFSQNFDVTSFPNAVFFII